jgi:uncharacterized protein YfaS (alpha-2-macroglobulin family)
MKTLLALLALTGIPLAFAPVQEGARADGFAELRRRAEAKFAEGSYALSRELYQQAGNFQLTDADRHWVEFRLADTRWRAAAATNDPDSSELDAASAELRRMLERYERAESRDDLWAEIHESVGDFHWLRRQSGNWGAGWPSYSEALDWWAGSSDLERARSRYLAIAFRAAMPDWQYQNSGWDYYPRYLPVEVLENAAKLARDPAEESHARFLLGKHYLGQWDRRSSERAEKELRRVLELGRDLDWYDDTLWALATRLESPGRYEKLADSTWGWRPDYRAAIELYRRIRTEYQTGQTRYWDEAESRIRNITSPSLGVGVDRFFLPESEVQYTLNWRNLRKADLRLVPVDLTRDPSFEQRSPGDWLWSLRLEADPVRSWSYETKDQGDHVPGSLALALEEKLAPGAYVLQARGGGQDARALVLVSDAAVTVKVSGAKLLAWVTDVHSGTPIPEASVHLWDQWYDGNEWRWADREARTGADGVALLALEKSRANRNWFVATRAGERQSFAQAWGPTAEDPPRDWRIYAFADRSAYRPKDTVSWKFLARERKGGREYSTPAGTLLAWEIFDPQGAVAGKGQATLNGFGSAATTHEIAANALLGEYRVQFWLGKREANQALGGATLFRIEEYKLPEFEVAVRIPEDPPGSGRTRLYRVGDRVEVTIEGTYYYGAPVSGATVEVFVNQSQHWRIPLKVREFPWCYEDPSPWRWWGGQQQIVHQTLATDASGHCTLAFDTPDDPNGEYSYSIEARVTDASRREVIGTGGVVVTQTGYTVEAELAHQIHRPGQKVEAKFTAKDPNGNPVEDDGHVVVTRQRWLERWIDPSGRQVWGQELEDLRRDPRGFPPAWQPPMRPWRLDFRGYEREVVAEGDLRTGKEGVASWSFVPVREGYYQIAWTSEDDRGVEVGAAVAAFVGDERTRDLGYLPGGIEILIDRDTLEVGETTPVMLAAPASGRWALFTIENEELLSHQVVRMDGTVRLLQLPILEAHVPNVWLSATMVADGQAWTDQEELVVPPVKQFLTVDVRPEHEAYRPGDEGTLLISVRDRAGEPVQVELAVALIDDALSYIQGDYARDVRQFFYGDRRALRVNSAGVFQHGGFVKLVKGDQGALVDERFAKDFDADDQEGGWQERDDRRMLREEGKLGFMKSEELEAATAGRAGGARGRQAANAPAVADEVSGAFRGPGDSVPAQGGTVVRVRSDFRETALWLPDVRTDARGQASVRVKLPDSTTRWKATVRASDERTRVGMGSGSTRTRQPLIARLQAPRFFVVGDEVVLSGNLNNNTESELSVSPLLEVEGLELLGEAGREEVHVPANGQARVDWRVRVRQAGEATLKLVAVAGDLADAVERKLPVHAHGIEALVAHAGKFTRGELVVPIELPEARGPGSTSLTVQVSPSLAVTMLDALPYLADYPYGCTEQTLSRFLPAAIVAKTLRDLGLSAEDAMARAFGGIEADSAGKTHPGGQKDLARLDEMIRQGLERLYDFQHGDGGWGWWKDGDSDAFMTAYVVWGLSLARDAKIDVRAGVLERGARYLGLEIVESEREPDLQAWMLHAFAVYGGPTGESEGPKAMAKAFDNLWTSRDRLNAYSRALFALAAHAMGRTDEARVLAENLANGAIVDQSPDASIVQVGARDPQPYTLRTAHWGNDGVWRRWSEGGVESTAFVLRALVAIDPMSPLVEPVMNWLVKNRRGAQWSNTRDTTITVLALNDYLRASGELGSAVEYQISVNGTSIATKRIEKDQLLSAPSSFAIDPALLRGGRNEVQIAKRAGEGPLYFVAHARFFSLEEPIPSRGSEIFLRREYYALVGRPTLLEGTVFDRVPLVDGGSVRSGDRVEVILTVDAKNDLEYIVLEDLKPAGLEAVQVKSGEPIQAHELKRSETQARFGETDSPADQERRKRGLARGETIVPRPDGSGMTGRSRSAHQELRDRKVAFFLDKLPQGTWELRYELRAEAPGSFHALPLLGHAMYVPEIRGNGVELRVSVVDRP